MEPGNANQAGAQRDGSGGLLRRPDAPQGDAEESPPPIAPGLFGNVRYDLPAGVVVFLVALPLCLGIALASGAPLLSGLIAGVVGGLIVPLFSRAPLSVSGPAAGLAAIVLVGIDRVGGMEAFALAVAIAGALQIALGLFKAGVIAKYMPSSVIKGMLAAIGVLLLLKQIPHAVGFDKEAFGALSFRSGGGNTFSLFLDALGTVHWGAVLISAMSLAMLWAWERVPALRRLSLLPGPLVVVVFAVLVNFAFASILPGLALRQEHLVTLSIESGLAGVASALRTPSFSAVTRPEVWTLGVTLAVVASLETLLNLEAVDRQDPWGRKSPPNKELVAQGAGNLVSGFLGGLPITSVIVRSSANVNAGARTSVSAFFHGAFLLLSVLFAAPLLSRIPLASLAAILLMTGYKLAKPKLFVETYRLGWNQFVPLVSTVVAIVLTDLLKGLAIGLAVGLVFVLKESASRAIDVIHDGAKLTIRVNKDAYFFIRGKLTSLLERIPEEARIIVVDLERAGFIDHDVVDVIRSFQASARQRNIEVVIVGQDGAAGLRAGPS